MPINPNIQPAISSWKNLLCGQCDHVHNFVGFTKLISELHSLEEFQSMFPSVKQSLIHLTHELQRFHSRKKHGKRYKSFRAHKARLRNCETINDLLSLSCSVELREVEYHSIVKRCLKSFLTDTQHFLKNRAGQSCPQFILRTGFCFNALAETTLAQICQFAGLLACVKLAHVNRTFQDLITNSKYYTATSTQVRCTFWNRPIDIVYNVNPLRNEITLASSWVFEKMTDKVKQTCMKVGRFLHENCSSIHVSIESNTVNSCFPIIFPVLNNTSSIQLDGSAPTQDAAEFWKSIRTKEQIVFKSYFLGPFFQGFFKDACVTMRASFDMRKSNFVESMVHLDELRAVRRLIVDDLATVLYYSCEVGDCEKNLVLDHFACMEEIELVVPWRSMSAGLLLLPATLKRLRISLRNLAYMDFSLARHSIEEIDLWLRLKSDQPLNLVTTVFDAMEIVQSLVIVKRVQFRICVGTPETLVKLAEAIDFSNRVGCIEHVQIEFLIQCNVVWDEGILGKSERYLLFDEMVKRWYKAAVLHRCGSKVKFHYTGYHSKYDEQWDEWRLPGPTKLLPLSFYGRIEDFSLPEDFDEKCELGSEKLGDVLLAHFGKHHKVTLFRNW